MEKSSKPKPFSEFFERRPVMVVSGLISLGLVFVFTGWAIDSGSLSDYAIALLSLFYGLRELGVAIFKRKYER